MPSRSSRPCVLLTVLLTVLALGVGLSASPAAATGYTPPGGVKTNDPLGSRSERRAIISHLLRSIDSSPKHSHIRIASWNVRSDAIVDALIRAHKRKVSVRLILARGNANPDNRNEGIDRLQRALHHYGNDKRRQSLKSHLHKCRRSCRGNSGIAHSKFFLFSRAGRAHDVVMNGSFNATDLASSSQWNDLYTVRGRPRVYREYRETFRQMFRDHSVSQGYRVRKFGSLETIMFPYTGKHTRTDPVLKELNHTRCGGARHGTNGHTRIRIAMTAWFGVRGKKIAGRLRQMQNRGCDVRIVYAVMGNEVLRILRNDGPKPVPMRQIVQDFNDDGVYDRYLHMKVMTINGVYRGNHGAWMTFNGSANWSPAVLASDEAVMRLSGRRTVHRYNTWLDHLFQHPPQKSRPAARSSRTTTQRDVDPYAKVQIH